MLKKILIPIYEKFEDVELVTPLDIWTRAGIPFDVYSFANSKKIKSSSGSVIVETTISEINISDYQAIFLHGGPAVNLMRKDQSLISLLKEFKNQNKFIFAICDAGNFLYENKIITNEKHTSYPFKNFKEERENWVNKYVVSDQKLITAHSPASALSFALKIVETLISKEKRLQIEEHLKINF